MTQASQMKTLFNLTIKRIEEICYQNLLKVLSDALGKNLPFSFPLSFVQSILRGAPRINFSRKLELENEIFIDLNRRNLQNIRQVMLIMEHTRLR